MCSAACASSRFLPSEAYGGSFPTTPIPGCMSYWISWALITGCTHGLQVRASSERLEGRRLKKKPTDSTGQGCEMVVAKFGRRGAAQTHPPVHPNNAVGGVESPAAVNVQVSRNVQLRPANGRWTAVPCETVRAWPPALGRYVPRAGAVGRTRYGTDDGHCPSGHGLHVHVDGNVAVRRVRRIVDWIVLVFFRVTGQHPQPMAREERPRTPGAEGNDRLQPAGDFPADRALRIADDAYHVLSIPAAAHRQASISAPRPQRQLPKHGRRRRPVRQARSDGVR